jgi:hypothetical protein
MPPDKDPLDADIHAFVTSARGSFSDLALRLFRHQFEANPPYRAYCEVLGRTPAEVAAWQDIPPVPTDAFKFGLPVCSFPAEEAGRVFLTSGTTIDTKGRHFLRDLHLYEASVTAGWKQADLPALDNSWFLAPDPSHTPESSLAAMFASLCPQTPSDRWLLSSEGSIVLDALREAIAGNEPVLLFSTALALLRLTKPLRLPPGSWVFQTGGYKGLGSAIDPATIYRHIETVLDVPPAQVINEYGMTELSSQAYSTGPGSPHRCPPWLRAQTIDPATSRPLAPGIPGYLVFYDLANVHSVLAIRTQDFGRVIDSSSFYLDGRDPGAVPRGCSRGSEAMIPPNA